MLYLSAGETGDQSDAHGHHENGQSRLPSLGPEIRAHVVSDEEHADRRYQSGIRQGSVQFRDYQQAYDGRHSGQHRQKETAERTYEHALALDLYVRHRFDFRFGENVGWWRIRWIPC